MSCHPPSNPPSTSFFSLTEKQTWVLDGDSLTDTQWTLGLTPWYEQLYQKLGQPSNLSMISVAVGGSHLKEQDALAQGPGGIDHRDWSHPGTRTVVYILWLGTNDIADGVEPNQVLDWMVEFLQHRQATGHFHRMVVLTPIPRSGLTLDGRGIPKNTRLQHLRERMLAQDGQVFKEQGVDQVIDLSQHPAFSNFDPTGGSEINSAYYRPDGVHLNNRGLAAVAEVVGEQLGITLMVEMTPESP